MITPLLNLAIPEMLMMQDTIWMVAMLMEVVLLWNLQKGFLGVPVTLGILGNIWAEVHLLVLDGALTVALMAIGLEIAKLGTGRTSVTAVGREVI
jgi:hypothetical protein